jgi:hypothetical protein
MDSRGGHTQINVPGKNTNPRTEIVFIAAESVAVLVLICTAERESYCATRLKACCLSAFSDDINQRNNDINQHNNNACRL